MRALAPTRAGEVGVRGVRTHYEVFGTGGPTVFLLMPDVIAQGRAWKAQVPFLARTCRVVTADPRGNGGSDRPTDPADYAFDGMVEDAWAVLAEVGSAAAVLCGVCSGAGLALIMAAEHPERVRGVVAINPGLPLTPPHPWKVAHDFDAVLDTEAGWAKLNRNYWQRDWPAFTRFFFDQMFPEPHSSKQVEDMVSWAGPTAEANLADVGAPPSRYSGEAAARAACAAVRCPVLVITGTEDRCQPPERGRIVADLTGGEHVEIDGAGHLPMARDPVFVNLLLRDFITRATR
ncbi:alpha/beta hydrolase [Occultella glacieicola]|uniref:Alpha/beta hydrolase n=1 Tax=Occultella glacieicola TaxID=2518684 RepID=A0ABY2E3B3_9MICO|nr:alpha/beta hydrolase [Occultella glacieicola]TDE94123.1 alpha/beta hydrolase [Occultella glacieicola]